MTDLSQVLWRKARASTGANTGCVEISVNLTTAVAVRDSTRPAHGAHLVPAAAFAAFLADAKSGRLDL